jgi:ATP-dependent 26S proteasome regulatory subunit
MLFAITNFALNRDVWGSLDRQVLLLLHLMPGFLTFLLVGVFIPKNIPSVAKVTQERQADPHSNYKPVPIKPSTENNTWNEVIIDDKTKFELISLVELLKDSEITKEYGIEVPKGVLLAGPPGTGKTTIARVIASTAGLSFFAVRLDEVVSKWVGESERNLSLLFKAAEKHAPSLIFIDEVDSIGAQRSGGQHAWQDNLLNHMLQLIDGVVKSKGINVIAATNRPDLVDSALKRAGRLNRIIEIPLPNFEMRRMLFALYLAKIKVAEQFNLDTLAKMTEGKSGADIKAICNQAGLNSFQRESVSGRREYLVTQNDMKEALKQFLVHNVISANHNYNGTGVINGNYHRDA